MKIKKKQLKAYGKLSDRSKLLQQSLWAYNERRLGTRSALNEEKATYLLQDKTFKVRITNLRKELEIPRLRLADDVVEIEVGNSIEAESKWLNSQPRDVYDRLKQEVAWLIENFNLTPNFESWLFSYILYRKTSNTPVFDWSLAHYVINNLDRIEEVTLTASERQYVLETFKLVTTANPKLTPQQVKVMGVQLKQALARSKRGTTRRSRTLKTALKTHKMGTKVSYYEPDLNTTIKRKITSLSLATELFDKDEEKKSHTLRKQKQRLQKRKGLLLKQK